MQIIMWLVLGASVALAALLDVHLRRAQVLDLANPVADGPVSFQFPADWKTFTRQDGEATAHVAQDLQDGVSRGLLVLRQRVPHPMSPAQFLIRADVVPTNVGGDGFKGILIDGWPGQTIKTGGRKISFDAASQIEFAETSAVILPDDQAIVFRMVKNQPFEPADQRLYEQVLDQVSISTTRPTDGGQVQLTDDIKIEVPNDLSLYPQLDPLSRDRVAATLTEAGGWVSVQFIPVVVPGSLPSISLQSGLAARERLDPGYPDLAQRWINADTTAQSANHWTLAPREAPDDGFAGHCIAHLLVGDGGDGVIVLLTAQAPADSDDLDRLWDMLLPGIHIAKSPPFDQAIQTGAAILQSGLPNRSAESWWMWTHDSLPIGFTHDFVEADEKSPGRYTVRRNWNGTVMAVEQRWGNSGSGTWASMRRSYAEANVNDPLVPFFRQSSIVTDQITTTIASQAGREAPIHVGIPPAFVLSRYLPDLLARVDQSPAAFWTDRFPGVEEELFPAPLLLLAHRIADDGGLRCVEAEVNGTGQSSRWYFAKDGSLDHADFAADLHLRPSTQTEIESSFAGDARLTIQPH
jgi:hypothetical protein